MWQQFHIHLGAEQTSNWDISSIVCHLVLRNPLDFGISTINNDTVAIEYHAKLCELTLPQDTELISLIIDEQDLAILRR